MGIPGTVSDDGKKILKAPNISILSDDVAIRIEKELDFPQPLFRIPELQRGENISAAEEREQEQLFV